MVIRLYTPEYKELWDNFVEESRCGTFLFKRDYMDYHSDRFADCSLMAFNRQGKLAATLPAEIHGTVISSHRGLTYGGWITPTRHFNGITMTEVFHAAIDAMRDIGAQELSYKPLPHIYQTMPAEEDLYVLFRLGAQQADSVLSSAIDLRNPVPMNENKRQAIRLAISKGVTISENDDFAGFWNMLEECLRVRHNAAPVHSLSEINRLKSCFPGNIRLLTASLDSTPVAGAVMYLCDKVARVQYMASTETGRKAKAPTAIIHHLCETCREKYDYIDLGGSNEPDTGEIDKGLLQFKSELGARGIAFPTYRIAL